MSLPAPETHNVQFDLETGQSSNTSGYLKPPSTRSDPEPEFTPSPILKRRRTRSNTVTSFRTLDKATRRPNWHPGQEPGLDPSKPNGGRSQTPTLHEDCQITVVDFSEDDIDMHDLNNAGLIKFINTKREDWIKCRWININGLSWDVIQALGNRMKLHRLAIEDLVNTNNRTKADWYTDHTYMVLTLQKLVHLHEDQDCDSDSDSDDNSSRKRAKRGPLMKALHKMFSTQKAKERYDEKQRKANVVAGVHDPMNG
jgi:Mg2+ and Co2+ transporter CorA